MTRGPHVLATHAGVLRTKVGAAFPGSRAVFRGHDLHKSDIKDLQRSVNEISRAVAGKRP